MKHRVRAKIAVSNRFREFDVIVENRCPGPVYWSMCIERLDPRSSKILETLTPSGQVQMEKKTRVNLRMNRISEESDSQLEFEKFYLDVGYARNPSLNAQCVASACEVKKGDLRKAFRANDKAIQKLNVALTDRISTECPQSGWSGDDYAECEAGIRQAAQAELDGLAEKQTELEAQLAAVEPDICQVY
jgi:cell division protein FtsB